MGAWDVVFIMVNNTSTFFWFCPTATSTSDLLRFNRAGWQWILMFSLYQCWPGSKNMDLNSIKVWEVSFFSRIHYRLHMYFELCHSHLGDKKKRLLWSWKSSDVLDVTLFFFSSAFQAMGLVPGVSVLSRLWWPQTVCSEQHQLAAVSRRRSGRQTVHKSGLDTHFRIKPFFFFLDL